LSQNAAAINAEILSRLNRSDEITAAQVYHWMNRVKKRVCSSGSPMDFMRRETILLAGSGWGTPGTFDTFDREYLLLPPNFLSLIKGAVLSATDVMLTSDEAELIYSSTPGPALFCFPSSTTEGSTGITSDATVETLHPCFLADGTFLLTELVDRGFTRISAFITALFAAHDDLVGNGSRVTHRIELFSPQTRRFGEKLDSDTTIPVAISGYTNPNVQAITAAMNPGSGVGYASPPWTGKQMEFYGKYLDVIGTYYPFIYLAYYGWPPDYNEPNYEYIQAPTVVSDVFTNTGEDLLIFGALSLAYLYLDDDARAIRYKQLAAAEEAQFRKHHAITQIESRKQIRRLRQGRAVTEI